MDMITSDEEKRALSLQLFRIWNVQQAALKELALLADINESDDENIEDVIAEYAHDNFEKIAETPELLTMFTIGRLSGDVLDALIIITSEVFGDRWYEKYPIPDEGDEENNQSDKLVVSYAEEIIRKHKQGDA
jgi:hypothetical protein